MPKEVFEHQQKRSIHVITELPQCVVPPWERHSQYPEGVGKGLISFSFPLPLFPISSALSTLILQTRVFNAAGSSPAAETNVSHLAALKPSTKHNTQIMKPGTSLEESQCPCGPISSWFVSFAQSG